MSLIPPEEAPRWRRILPTLLLACAAALAARSLGLPLPWMIGPLFAVAGLRMAGLRLAAPRGGRQAGQWAIGAALGLVFSPAVLAQLVEHALLVAGVALAALLLGGLWGLLTLRLARVDVPTAFFAALPGGASEMATLAERWGGAVDRIAAAHALRVLLVVSLVPLALAAAGVHGSDPYAAPARALVPAQLPGLLAASLAGVGLFRLLGLANGWVLGPLLGVGAAGALGLPLSALPAGVVNGGQLLIACSLGCRFSPEFFRAAPRFMAVAGLCGLLSIGASFALAWALAPLAGLPPGALALAAAPGGVAEMCITAQVLQLGVPLVTACHVLRVAVLTLGAPPAFRLFRRLAGAGGRA